MSQLTHDEKELDRKQDVNIYGLRSFSPDDLCQYCESTDGMIVVWDNPELVMEGDWTKDTELSFVERDTFTLENCPECNQKGDK